jgi:DNA repair protein RadC
MDEVRTTNGAVMVREMPAEERPRERLARYGADVLGTAELIAILLRTGTAGTDVMAVASGLLSRFGGLGGLARASLVELGAAPGIGPAKAAELQAAIALGVRAASVSPESRPLLRSPEDVAEMLLHEMSLLEREHVRVMNLDTRLRLLSITEVYVGSVHQAHVRFGELLRDAIRVGASSVVLVHNHPSGDPTPSLADIAMTKGLVAAGGLMDVDVHDHIVIGGGRYVSMKVANLGFATS